MRAHHGMVLLLSSAALAASCSLSMFPGVAPAAQFDVKFKWDVERPAEDRVLWVSGRVEERAGDIHMAGTEVGSAPTVKYQRGGTQLVFDEVANGDNRVVVVEFRESISTAAPVLYYGVSGRFSLQAGEEDAAPEVAVNIRAAPGVINIPSVHVVTPEGATAVPAADVVLELVPDTAVTAFITNTAGFPAGEVEERQLLAGTMVRPGVHRVPWTLRGEDASGTCGTSTRCARQVFVQLEDEFHYPSVVLTAAVELDPRAQDPSIRCTRETYALQDTIRCTVDAAEPVHAEVAVTNSAGATDASFFPAPPVAEYTTQFIFTRVVDGSAPRVTTPTVPDGTYEVSAVTRDLAGNTRMATAVFHVDSREPELLDARRWVERAGSRLADDAIARAGDVVVVEFSLPADERLAADPRAALGGNPMSGALAGETWHFTRQLVAGEDTNGRYLVVVQLEDQAGNLATARLLGLEVSIDVLSPGVASPTAIIITPAPHVEERFVVAAGEGGQFSVLLTTTEVLSELPIVSATPRAGGAPVQVPCEDRAGFQAFTCTLTVDGAMNQGEYDAVAHVVDLAGNAADSELVLTAPGMVVDTLPPPRPRLDVPGCVVFERARNRTELPFVVRLSDAEECAGGLEAGSTLVVLDKAEVNEAVELGRAEVVDGSAVAVAAGASDRSEVFILATDGAGNSVGDVSMGRVRAARVRSGRSLLDMRNFTPTTTGLLFGVHSSFRPTLIAEPAHVVPLTQSALNAVGLRGGAGVSVTGRLGWRFRGTPNLGQGGIPMVEGASAEVESIQGHWLVFGAQPDRSEATAVYITNSGQWAEIFSPPGTAAPGNRTDPFSVMDTHRRTWVMFGGGRPDDASTWEYDGEWRLKISATTSPRPRSMAAGTCDPTRSLAIMHGGRAGSEVLGDLWAWDGTRWTEASVQGFAPQARAGHSLVFDPVRDVVILFGGEDASGRLLNDVWEYHVGASTWVELQPEGPRPRARKQHAAALDPVSGNMLITAGLPNTIEDTWAWDGVAWTNLHVPGQPVPRGAGGTLRLNPLTGTLQLLHSSPTASSYLWDWTGTHWLGVGNAASSVRLLVNPADGRVFYVQTSNDFFAAPAELRVHVPSEDRFETRLTFTAPDGLNFREKLVDAARNRLLLLPTGSDPRLRAVDLSTGAVDAVDVPASFTGEPSNDVGAMDTLRDRLMMLRRNLQNGVLEQWAWDAMTGAWERGVDLSPSMVPGLGNPSLLWVYDAPRDRFVLVTGLQGGTASALAYHPASRAWETLGTFMLPAGGVASFTIDSRRDQALLLNCPPLPATCSMRGIALDRLVAGVDASAFETVSTLGVSPSNLGGLAYEPSEDSLICVSSSAGKRESIWELPLVGRSAVVYLGVENNVAAPRGRVTRVVLELNAGATATALGGGAIHGVEILGLDTRGPRWTVRATNQLAADDAAQVVTVAEVRDPAELAASQIRFNTESLVFAVVPRATGPLEESVRLFVDSPSYVVEYED